MAMPAVAKRREPSSSAAQKNLSADSCRTKRRPAADILNGPQEHSSVQPSKKRRTSSRDQNPAADAAAADANSSLTLASMSSLPLFACDDALAHLWLASGVSELSSVPRVVSSAHINSLVAKYSHPLPEQDMWSPRGFPADAPAFLDDISRVHDGSLGLHLHGPPAVGRADFTPQLMYGGYPELYPIAALPTLPATGLHEETGDAGVGFQGMYPWVTTMVGGAQKQSQSGSMDAPAVVEDLDIAEDTRHAVEDWLRDAPDAEAPQAPESERTLPVWVLEELGEGGVQEQEQEQQPQSRRLERTWSQESSTHGPSERRGASSRREERAEASVMSDARAGEPEMEVGSNGGEGAGMLEDEVFVTPAASVEKILEGESASSAEEHRREEEADSLCCSQGSAQGLNRSFSTTWIKELLDDSSIFHGDALPLPAHSGGLHSEAALPCDVLDAAFLGYPLETDPLP